MTVYNRLIVYLHSHKFPSNLQVKCQKKGKERNHPQKKTHRDQVLLLGEILG